MLELVKEGQDETVRRYKDDGRLHVPTLEGKDMVAIGQLKALFEGKTNVSIADCSVWYYAKQHKYVLLTGDRKLRKASVLDGVEVHGIIYVFDSLVASNIITKNDAAAKLRQLYSINPRLPKDAIDERLKLWETDNEKEECLRQNDTPRKNPHSLTEERGR